MLAGRETERSALAELLVAARAGHAGVLQLVGDAGIGQRTLIADIVARAEDFRLLKAVGALLH